MVVTGSTLSSNQAGLDGGGIANNNDTLTLTNSTISGNQASRFGGGIDNALGTLTVTNSTITGNTADLGGGGIHNNVATATLNNTVVAGNVVNIQLGVPDDIFGDVNPASANNLIGDPDSAGGLRHDSDGDPAAGLNNIVGRDSGTGGRELLEVSTVLGPLASNGGPTKTHALLIGSPAIDTGNNSLALGPGPDGVLGGNDDVPLTIDQRGMPRLIDGGSGTATVDIGAYEREVIDPRFVVNTTVDELDFSNAIVSLREAIRSANDSAGPDTLSFDSALTAAGAVTITLSMGELQIIDDLTITGPGQDLLTIDVNQQSRVLNILPGDFDVSLSGLTITGGQTTAVGSAGGAGGGIRFDSTGTLAIQNTTVTGNKTTGDEAEGGGIDAGAGTLSVIGSTISGNSTSGYDGYGGGIAVVDGSVTITRSTISGNSTEGNSADGGGIYLLRSTATITDSTISGNRTTGINADGGGIYHDAGNLTITRSTISGNSVTGDKCDGGHVRRRWDF